MKNLARTAYNYWGEILLAVLVAAICLVEYPLGHDGPSHVYNAQVIRDLLRDPGSRFHSFYSLHLVPNLTAAALMGVFTGLFSPPAALRAFQVFLIVLSFFSFHWFARSFPQRAVGLSLLSLFFALNWFFWMAFHNFVLGLDMALLGGAFLIRRMPRWSWLDAAGLSLFCALLVLTHALPSLLLALFIAAIVLYAYLFPPPNAIWLQARSGGSLVSLVAPFLVCVTAFPFLEAIKPAGFKVPFLLNSARGLLQALVYFPIDALETLRVPFADGRFIVGAQAVLILYLAAARWRQGILSLLRAPLFVAGAALFFMRILIHDGGGGGGFVNPRFGLLSWFFLALDAWFFCPSEALRAAVRLVMALSLTVSIAAYGLILQGVDKGTKELLAAARTLPIQPGQTMIFVRYETPQLHHSLDLHLLRMGDPLSQWHAWTAMETGAIDLSNYEAHSYWFPTQFLYSSDPTLVIRLDEMLDSMAHGHAAQLNDYLSRAPSKPDHILVMGEEGFDWQPNGGHPGLFETLRTHGYRSVLEKGSPPYLRSFARSPQ